MSQEIEADILAGNSSQEVEVIEVNSDEEVEQNDDVFWQRANTTPVTKSCNNEVPVYVGIFTVISCRKMYISHVISLCSVIVLHAYVHRRRQSIKGDS